MTISVSDPVTVEYFRPYPDESEELTDTHMTEEFNSIDILSNGWVRGVRDDRTIFLPRDRICSIQTTD